MNTATINQLREAGTHVILQVNADELQGIIRDTLNEERQRIKAELAANRERPTLTRKEAAAQLNVSEQTMSRWMPDGYLIPVKIGRKVLYRQSDIDAILLAKDGQD